MATHCRRHCKPVSEQIPDLVQQYDWHLNVVLLQVRLLYRMATAWPQTLI
jgi:anaerobic C4-dicarboxylate transporter